MIRRTTQKTTEYAAGSALVAVTATLAQDATIAAAAFAIAAPAMVYCRVVVENQ